MRALVILNPAAPRAAALRSAWFRVRRALEDAGYTAELQETAGPSAATELARTAAADGVELVLAGGGDGTINEVVNGLVGSGTALGVIPIGTTNVWGREVGLPWDPVEAVQAQLGGQVRTMDLGKAGERYFLLMAGVGFDGYVMRAVTPATKRRFGIPAYLLAGLLTALSFRSTAATIECDGVRRTVSPLHLAVFGNTRRYATAEITTQALADDGQLDVCIFAGPHAWYRRARHFVAVLLRRHTESRWVSYGRARRARVAAARPLPVQLDGDFVGYTPLDIAAVPGALRVLLPARPLPIFSVQPSAIS